jgi:hypothetical protein
VGRALKSGPTAQPVSAAPAAETLSLPASAQSDPTLPLLLEPGHLMRQFEPQDTDLTAQIREGQGKIFGEDMQMLEMQQANLLRHPTRKLLMLKIDAGGVQSRRVIDQILSAEQAARVTAQA